MSGRGAEKVLIYGGAFNPPHLGHMRIFSRALDFIKPDVALIMPSPVSPHKQSAAVSLSIRSQMCRVFKKLDDCVKISEIERAGRHDKSFTVKTLRRLRKKYKQARFYLLIGSDMLLSFETWHRFRRILPMCTLVAASRTGDDMSALEAEAKRLERLDGRVLIMQYDALPMSSSDIRKTYSLGGSAAEMLDADVAKTIDRLGLYR